jgi:hypothetical protein
MSGINRRPCAIGPAHFDNPTNPENRTMKILLACLTLVLLSVGVSAAPKPINLSITPDLALYGRSERIEGLTLSIWGENPQVALALGIANGSTGQSAGLSWAFVLNYADDYQGIQWAPINYTTGNFLGWQHGFVNYAGGSMRGLQSGAVNYTRRLTGLQFGVVNFADDADTGVQIGVVNIIRSNNRWFSDLPEELAPAMIFVNWRF